MHHGTTVSSWLIHGACTRRWDELITPTNNRKLFSHVTLTWCCFFACGNNGGAPPAVRHRLSERTFMTNVVKMWIQLLLDRTDVESQQAIHSSSGSSRKLISQTVLCLTSRKREKCCEHGQNSPSPSSDDKLWHCPFLLHLFRSFIHLICIFNPNSSLSVLISLWCDLISNLQHGWN